MVHIGLDIGGSGTKVVGFRNGCLLGETSVRASDPLSSAYGGLGKFLSLQQLEMRAVNSVMVTGVGASHIQGDLMGIPTQKADEFRAVGLGGLYCSGFAKAVVVSMGTGTSIVYCDGDRCEHIIGSGVGGGTVLGLSSRLLNVRDAQKIAEIAAGGDLRQVDLSIGDISAAMIAGLDWDTTASNFGKLEEDAGAADLALGLLNLVFQSVGTAAILSARLKDIREIVFVGSMLEFHQGSDILQQFARLYNVEIIIPRHAGFATAIGAALIAQ